MTQAKVLVADKLSPKGIEILRAADGLQVEVKTGLTPDELIAEIPSYRGLIVRSTTQVTANVLEAAANLKLVGRAGIGTDNIDVEVASKRGIIVMNAPEGNSVTAAEHTIALMLSLSRKIPQATASMKAGQWEKNKFMGVEVCHKTLGVIGLGRIGRLVAKRAQALGMTTIGHDPYISSEAAEALGVPLVELDELVRRSDYITVHTPKTDATTYLIGEPEFEKMKKGVRILNCARGGIFDERALYQALASGKVAGAALDVFEQEPPRDNPLIGLDSVICTPHLGASTEEAQDNVAIEMAEQVVSFFQKGEIRNAVNVPTLSAELLQKMEPYLGLMEKLGRLTAQLVEGGLRQVRISYSGEVSSHDIRYLTVVFLKGLLEHFLREGVNLVNALILARERGIRVVENITSETEDYASLIQVETVTDKEEGQLAGTLYGRKDARLVRINGYPVEVVLSGHLLIFSNKDLPGVVGRVGTILGSSQINIAEMHLGRKDSGGTATAIVSVDSQVPESVLQEIRALPQIFYVRTANCR
ncbi:MAG: phosphoglycerate dehydrogenase [Candidatus Tectomicrobia bacterium]|uniref:D-3-phosphoglycerate dehydrogenase n=1 Tax=Tectimicrobiota bacterium TaxID=2528274 RepID=A0A932FXS6_UNCTE|nr:phosphoglycerate dehydrogenase [Candidatus Tectomicrobia bacterium]